LKIVALLMLVFYSVFLVPAAINLIRRGVVGLLRSRASYLPYRITVTGNLLALLQGVGLLVAIPIAFCVILSR
jgi:hypothetical protein